MRLHAEARARDLTPVGPVQGWTACTVLPRFNALGTWVLTVPNARLHGEVREALKDGGGVRFTDLDRPDAPPLLSGPVDEDDDVWDRRDAWDGSLTLSGVSDLHVLDDRVTHPVPSAPTGNQSGAAYDVRGPGPAETVLKAYVTANAGPGARTDRRHPGLLIGPDQSRGATVKGSTRLQNLLELCTELAGAGGLGFAVDQVENELVFDVTVPQLRDGVLIAKEAGTARGGSATRRAPSMTHAIVAAQRLVDDDPTTRLIAEVTTAESLAAAAQWGRRIERLVDRRDTDDPDLVQQAGVEALLDGAATGALAVTAADTEQTRYARDYQLGDRVPWSWRGVETVDVVREVKITAVPGGTVVEPVLGPPGASGASSDTYQRIQALEAAVRALQGRL